MSAVSAKLVDAAALAELIGTSRAWVYANAGSLEPLRLGTGPRARLRFDVDRVRQLLAENAAAGRHESELERPSVPRPQRQRGSKRAGSILACRPRDVRP